MSWYPLVSLGASWASVPLSGAASICTVQPDRADLDKVGNMPIVKSLSEFLWSPFWRGQMCRGFSYRGALHTVLWLGQLVCRRLQPGNVWVEVATTVSLATALHWLRAFHVVCVTDLTRGFKVTPKALGHAFGQNSRLRWKAEAHQLLKAKSPVLAKIQFPSEAKLVFTGLYRHTVARVAGLVLPRLLSGPLGCNLVLFRLLPSLRPVRGDADILEERRKRRLAKAVRISVLIGVTLLLQSTLQDTELGAYHDSLYAVVDNIRSFFRNSRGPADVVGAQGLWFFAEVIPEVVAILVE